MERWNLYSGCLVMHTGVLARVEKVNPRWTIVQHEDGSRYNANPDRLEPAPEGSVFRIEEAEGLELGDPVRFISGKAAADQSVYVVLDVKPGRTYKLARLRGSGNRFYRSVPASNIALIPDGEVHV